MTKYNPSTLTKREAKCLSLAAQDKSIEATAVCMHVAPDTIKKYRKMIMKKLGCHTMVGALGFAIRHDILSNYVNLS